MRTASFTFLEFFSGGGMAREGLGPSWQCLFANDIDPMKGRAYAMNFGRDHLRTCDIAALTIADMPTATADLAWASFPCQDLSLAGEGAGLKGKRSGTVLEFFRLMRELKEACRAPRTIVLENVVGWLTSQNGKDFAAVVEALSEMGYRSGAVVIDAAHFVSQSRERVFLVAVREDIALPPALCADGPREGWHPASMVRAVAGEPSWAWWRAPTPAQRNSVFADLVEEQPSGVAWDPPTKTAHILGLMTPAHRQKVAEAQATGRRAVGTLYRRTRPNAEGGGKQQRAEVRFDNIAGCLRVPTGGSSRQTILVVEGESCGATIRMRIAFAVGTLISERPPHRTGRARFGHPAPTSGV